MKQRKILLTLFTILSIVGYGAFVFAATGPFAPGTELDPGCSYTDPDCTVDLSLTGISIGSPVVSGIPNQILYTDADGKVFGDSVFTRDSTTGNTTIGLANGVVASSMSILNTGNTLTWDANTNDSILDGLLQGNNLNGAGIKGNALAHYNTSTYESATFFVGDTTANGGNPYEASMTYVIPGGINGFFGYTVNDDGLKAEYYDIVGNIKSQTLQEATGNTISWDADTTDDIQDLITQSQNLLGFGIAGSMMQRTDTSTSESAWVATFDAGGMAAQLKYVDTFPSPTISSDVTVGATSAALFHTENSNGQIGSLRLGATGNTLTWDVDTTDTIITTLVQSEDVLGFGVTGTWNAWQDTSTDIASAVGAGDLTTFGQGPGSTAMISLNTATMDRAVIATQYNLGDTTFKIDNKVINGDSENNFNLDKTGSTLTWDFDTTDNIQDIISQGQSIGGSPFKGNGIAHLDTVTGENAYLIIGDATGIGQRPFTSLLAYTGPGLTLNHEFRAEDTGAAMSHSDSVANTLGYMTTFTGGNAMTWDGDTTDDLADTIEQGDNILSAGIKGNLIVHRDTVTGERANIVVGDITGAGGAAFQISMNTDDGTGNLDSWFDLNHVNGVFTGVEDLTNNVTSGLELSLRGNTLTWDADTTDDIVTSLEQNEDILGLGLIAGSALTWSDSNAGIQAVIGTGDTTIGGGNPGTASMVTLEGGNTASFSTEYDVLANTVRSNINVLDGLFSASGSFDNGGISFNFANPGTFDSGVRIDSTSSSLRFTNAAAESTLASVYDKEFRLTVGLDTFLSFDAGNGLYEIGDIGSVGSGTLFSLDDSAALITINSNNGIVVDDNNLHTCTITGDVGGTCTSDERLKTNIIDLPTNTLDQIRDLRTVTYTWNSGRDQTTNRIGFLAQNVQLIYPELVGTDPNGYLGVNYAGFTPVLVEAIRELDVKITDIENFASAENKTFLNNLIAWLGDVGNGVEKLFAKEVHTDTLCVGETCVTESQLQELLQGQSITSGGSSADDSSELESESDADISGSDENETDSVDDTLSDPLPEPESDPEPVSEPGLAPDSGEVSETI